MIPRETKVPWPRISNLTQRMTPAELAQFNELLPIAEIKPTPKGGKCMKGEDWNATIRPIMLDKAKEGQADKPALTSHPVLHWIKIKDRKPMEGQKVVLLLMDGRMRYLAEGWKKEVDQSALSSSLFIDGAYPFAWLPDYSINHLADYMQKVAKYRLDE